MFVCDQVEEEAEEDVDEEELALKDELLANEESLYAANIMA
jgi:hypothetical protein